MPEAAWLILGWGWIVVALAFVQWRRITTRFKAIGHEPRSFPRAERVVVALVCACVFSLVVPLVRGASATVTVFWALAVVPAAEVCILVTFGVVVVAQRCRDRSKRP